MQNSCSPAGCPDVISRRYPPTSPANFEQKNEKMKSICCTRWFNIFISLNILLGAESVDASRAIRHSNRPASTLHSRKIRSRTSCCRCRCNESLRLPTRSLNPPWNIRCWNIQRLQQRRQSCSKTHFQLKVASEPRGIVWIAFSATEEGCWDQLKWTLTRATSNSKNIIVGVIKSLSKPSSKFAERFVFDLDFELTQSGSFSAGIEFISISQTSLTFPQDIFDKLLIL